MTNDKLRKFLSNAPVRRGCSICANEELTATIDAHLDMLRDGETSISLSYVHEHFIIPEFGKPLSYDTIRAHVRRCLKRAPATGESL